MAAFLEYDWPGNVRELNNILERLVILADSDTLTTACLPANFRANYQHTRLNNPANSQGNLTTLPELTTLERSLIEKTLKETNFNKAATAKKLGIPRSTLYYKMQQLKLTGDTVRHLTQASES